MEGKCFKILGIHLILWTSKKENVSKIGTNFKIFCLFPQLCFHSNRNEPNYAATLSSIIIIFIICHLPRLIKTVYEIAFTKMVKNSGGSCDGFVNPSKCLVYFNNFILVINASSGFFVYCFIGSFGKKFIEVLSQNCRRGKSASNTVYILQQ